jgi:putative CocE/NonD family hydrolase
MKPTFRLISLAAIMMMAMALVSVIGSGVRAQAQAQAIQPQLAPAEKVSRFGEYRGYSFEVYDSWVRTSSYLTMRDGVRLAADIFRPAVKGKVEDKPLPVIFIHSRYHRASVQNGKLESEADSPFYLPFLKRGYVFVIVDIRGSGASFGTWNGIFAQDETKDAFEIIEWIARQAWCNGRVGMSGASYLGATQLMAASTRPPHLKALLPIVPLFDIYDIAYHNGVFMEDMVKMWSNLTRLLDVDIPAAPVDADRDGTLLKQALREHAANRPLIDIIKVLRFRDGRDQFTSSYVYRDWGAASRVKDISDSGIPMYIWSGWLDAFTRDVFLMQRNFKVPLKLGVGAWSHSPEDPDVQKEELNTILFEALRWFDYWLKGIDNGVMAEPPIHYQVMIAPKVNAWRTSRTWPLPEAKPREYYLAAGPSGSLASPNDGSLLLIKPSVVAGGDARVVDFSATTGTSTRWDNAVGGNFGYPDLASNDKKGLTYTTPPLAGDVEITGHPVVHLWVSTTATDGDFFAYLEEVEPSGVSHYVTEGAIKVSYRQLNRASYDALGLPYHRCFADDVSPLMPGQPVELVFDLQPIANVFNAGNRIRMTITGADKDNAETTPVTPPPMITVLRDPAHPSRIVLPVVGH